MNLSHAKKLCEHVHQEKGCLHCVQYAESIKRSSGGEAGPELELKDDSVSGEQDADEAVLDEDEEAGANAEQPVVEAEEVVAQHTLLASNL